MCINEKANWSRYLRGEPSCEVVVVPKSTAFLHQGQGDASAQIVLFIRILEIELKEFQFIDFANKGNSLFLEVHFV